MLKDSGGFIAPLLGQRFRRKNASDRREQTKVFEKNQLEFENRRNEGDRRDPSSKTQANEDID
jgi:hypothetical protein